MFKNFNQTLRGVSGSQMKDGNETNKFKENKEGPGKFMSNMSSKLLWMGKEWKSKGQRVRRNIFEIPKISNIVLHQIWTSNIDSNRKWLLLKCSVIGIGFNGAETNYRIAHTLGILLMNNYDF